MRAYGEPWENMKLRECRKNRELSEDMRSKGIQCNMLIFLTYTLNETCMISDSSDIFI